VVYKTNEGKEDRLAGGGLDHGGLANAGSVKIDVCAFLGSLCGHVKIEDLHDVAD
jgi:hypothetical protein